LASPPVPADEAHAAAVVVGKHPLDPAVAVKRLAHMCGRHRHIGGQYNKRFYPTGSAGLGRAPAEGVENYSHDASVRMTRKATTITSKRRTAPTNVISDYVSPTPASGLIPLRRDREPLATDAAPLNIGLTRSLAIHESSLQL